MEKPQSELDKTLLATSPSDIIKLILTFYYQLRELDRLLDEWGKILIRCKGAAFILHDVDIQSSRGVRTFIPFQFDWNDRVIISMNVFIHYPPEEQELKSGVTLILDSERHFKLMDDSHISTTSNIYTIQKNGANDDVDQKKKTMKNKMMKFIGLHPKDKKLISV